MSPTLKNRFFRGPAWLIVLLAINGAATGFALVYVLAQNAVNLRVVASETPQQRAYRLWENRPVLAEARARIPEGEPVLLVSGRRAAFRRFIAHYALYPRRVERLEFEQLPADDELERLARQRSIRWITVDGKSGLAEHDKEDRVWKSSE